MPPSNHPAYHKEEKVFCFHHEILYEAKIVEVKLSDPDDKKSPYEYRVHYKGWKNTYVPFPFCYPEVAVDIFLRIPVIPRIKVPHFVKHWPLGSGGSRCTLGLVSEMHTRMHPLFGASCGGGGSAGNKHHVRALPHSC